MSGRVAGLVALAVLLAACASGAADDEPDRVGGGDGVPGETRFVLEVGDGEHPPILVQATSESRPVAWLRVRRDGATVSVEERCEIPDCGAPGDAVCGASLPTVRQIAPEDGAGAIAYYWSGAWSVIENGACERREPAPAGDYVARFCWAHTADTDGDPAAPSGAIGRITDPTCVDRTFRLGRDADVIVRIP